MKFSCKEIRIHSIVLCKIGHFTQVVWKDTKELGIAKATGKKGGTYVVANYNPSGNFIGKFSENVPKP